MAIGDAFLRRQIMCASDRSMHQSGIILEVIREADRSARTRRGFEVADVDCAATYQMVLRLFNGARFNAGSELTRYGIGPWDQRSDGPVPRRLVCTHGEKDYAVPAVPPPICALLNVGSLARAPGGWSRSRGGAAATLAQDATARARPSERYDRWHPPIVSGFHGPGSVRLWRNYACIMVEIWRKAPSL
jgi:hypothetical protein